MLLGWGNKKSGKRARYFASYYQQSYALLEDGFLRSLDLGVNGDPPLSLVYDEVGIYYDTSRPSKLEQLILECDGQEDLSEAQRALSLIRRYRLSKYNHALDFPDDAKPKNRPVVLVVDQTFGDMAVRYGGASAETFDQMLTAAILENPHADIWLKVHPDVLSGKKRGYFSSLPQHPNITIISESYHPISLLEAVDKVYCVTSQMGFEALMLDKEVVTFGVPWYAGWGLTDDRHPLAVELAQSHRRAKRSCLQLFHAAYMQYARYLNPITHERGSVFDVIDYLHQKKRYNQRLAGDVYAVGLSLWKKAVIRPFLNFPACRLHFVSSLKKLSKKVLPSDAKLLVWGQGQSSLLDFAHEKHLSVIRMEDGFIRSVGLGSNLVAPLSLVIDDKGIYFNAQSTSRLEHILEHTVFTSDELIEAEKIQQALIDAQIGKYNVGQTGFQRPDTDQKVILVTGQVEDDASITYGSPKIKTNLALLETVRSLNPHDYVIYKPHPDVLSGNRVGHIETNEVLKYADLIVSDVNILDCIEQVDEIHTLTSLAGFEALIRGKKVCCYGLPFYAAWGLTHDYVLTDEIKTRRSKRLQLNELIAGTLLHYPLYLDPVTHQFSHASKVISYLRASKTSTVVKIQRLWITKQISKLKQITKMWWVNKRY
ncbi:capsule biosynthesis protein [Basilea psittacipulmonis DSM 24701]|uniref:Capsule biosynthesis protein n=1 Tax=Basilea psittacipulmonis DSM 24701 TaxID=1072685 RepID=A0A077DGM7_9BURK|nr:capsule biosynthesis protein [Basilea psittacipulmonis DSM 24701]